MPVSLQVAKSSLERKGFIKDNSGDIVFRFYFNGKDTGVKTMISHGRGEIDDRMLGMMARQMKITHGQTVSFLRCDLSQAEYESLLESKGILHRDDRRA